MQKDVKKQAYDCVNMIYNMTAGQGYEISSIFIILFAESFEHRADSMDKISRDTRGVFKNQEIQFFIVLFNFKPLFTRLKSYKSSQILYWLNSVLKNYICLSEY